MVEPSQPPIKASDVPAFEHTPGGSVRFVHGYDHGVRTVTLAISDNPPGGDAPEHRHPWGEVFVVSEGRGVYSVDGVDIVAAAGDVVVVPPHTLHSFRADGDTPLRHVAAFDRGRVDTEVH